MQRYRCSNAIVGAALIAAAAMLMPAMLHAQEGSPEVTPPIPGMSWGSPPVQREWEPTAKGDAVQGSSEGSSQGSAQDAQDDANAEVLMAQQVMAEQSKRMADFMFWQLILGVALLIGVCVTIYYARQIARAAVNVSPGAPVTADPTRLAKSANHNKSHITRPVSIGLGRLLRSVKEFGLPETPLKAGKKGRRLEGEARRRAD